MSEEQVKVEQILDGLQERLGQAMEELETGPHAAWVALSVIARQLNALAQAAIDLVRLDAD